MKRRATRNVPVGTASIGGSEPVSVQTMWDRPLGPDDDPIIQTIHELHRSGCDIIRFSAHSEDDIDRLSLLSRRSPLPIVADIHFDYRLAVRALRSGIPKIRINPGNIGTEWKVREVIAAADHNGAAIRIGLNGGSLPKNLRSRPDRAEAMYELAGSYISLFEAAGFSRIVVSLKDSDPETAYRAYRLFSENFDYPLHLGVTEAGPIIPSITKSAVFLGRLLAEGIGDTLRISITGPLMDEVKAGTELLKVLGLRRAGARLVSCPKCGRASFDTHWFVSRIDHLLQEISADLSIAVMGCAVNGPGEASHADIGITGIGREVFLFRRGEIVRRTTLDTCIEDFKQELRMVLDEKADH